MMRQMMMKTLRIVTKKLQRMKGTNKSPIQTQTMENILLCIGIIHGHITGKNMRKYLRMTWTSRQRKQNLNFCRREG